MTFRLIFKIVLSGGIRKLLILILTTYFILLTEGKSITRKLVLLRTLSIIHWLKLEYILWEFML